MSKFTRRELAAALSTSTLLLARPQAQPAAPAPPATPPVTPDDELKASRAQLRDNADQLDKFPLPMSTHPATIFKP
jgi:hypothetical protein